LLPLRAGQVRAGARIPWTLISVRSAGGGDLRAGAEALVDVVSQPAERGFMVRGALGLEDRRSVPVQAQPAQLLELLLGHPRPYAGLVDVLDTEGIPCALLSGPEPGEQGGAGVPKMQLAGGTGRESSSL